MKNDIDAQFLCKDCSRYSQCRYYHNRKEDSYICKYFEFHLAVPDKESCDDVLDKIKAEIESNMESIIGKYDSSIPKSNMPSYKIERNKARKECISIIDKYKADKKDCTTCIGFGDKDYAQSFCHDCIKDIQNHYKGDKGVEE